MRFRLRRVVPAVLVGAAALLLVPAASADTYGRLERARVMSTPPIEIVAKLDTGADRSALNAVDVKYFLRDGDTWARFTIDSGSVLPGSRVSVERPVLRDVKVRQKGGGVEHRPVVAMEFCIGDRLLKAELNLSDRTGYTAPLLIGRSELEKLGSVDASREFTHDAICKPSAAAEDGVIPEPRTTKSSAEPAAIPAVRSIEVAAKFQCDGRVYCAQMRSCDEAKFFLANCPGVKMDNHGSGNGMPCEKQWCR